MRPSKTCPQRSTEIHDYEQFDFALNLKANPSALADRTFSFRDE